jgi:pimeloyl-ACP methyl ester carboxylesterase
MKRVRVNGTELAFDEAGGGERALLLIHGHPFDRSMWQPQIGWAAQLGWRVIAPDLRGYGARMGQVRRRRWRSLLATCSPSWIT